MKTLIVVDVQYDFLPGGSLAVDGGDEIIPVINEMIPDYDIVIFTMDFHPSNHKSFASNHSKKKPFNVIKLNGIDQVLWPDHCVQGTEGADLCQDLDFAACKNLYIFKKGMNPEVDSYSGFYDNGTKDEPVGASTGLAEFLESKEVKEVDIVGLAFDYCVAWTAQDAVDEGLTTRIFMDGTRSIGTDSDLEKTKKNLKKIGVGIFTYQ